MVVAGIRCLPYRYTFTLLAMKEASSANRADYGFDPEQAVVIKIEED